MVYYCLSSIEEEYCYKYHNSVVVTCSYYNTGNYATTIEDRTTDDRQINYKVDPE